jgi:hypothetical protein
MTYSNRFLGGLAMTLFKELMICMLRVQNKI